MRGYKKEYNSYHAKPEQKKNRAARNKARTLLSSSGRVSKGDGRDVDHRNGNPRTNSKSNLSVISKRRNRSKK